MSDAELHCALQYIAQLPPDAARVGPHVVLVAPPRFTHTYCVGRRTSLKNRRIFHRFDWRFAVDADVISII